jgi:hypothetical protein
VLLVLVECLPQVGWDMGNIEFEQFLSLEIQYEF